jgi:hypothetical protein
MNNLTVESERRIICAAMRMMDGEIILGVRHFSPDMRRTLHRIYGEGYHLKVEEQGFIDQWGNFSDREESWNIALRAQQIRHRVSGDGELYSECLY